MNILELKENDCAIIKKVVVKSQSLKRRLSSFGLMENKKILFLKKCCCGETVVLKLNTTIFFLRITKDFDIIVEKC